MAPKFADPFAMHEALLSALPRTAPTPSILRGKSDFAVLDLLADYLFGRLSLNPAKSCHRL